MAYVPGEVVRRAINPTLTPAAARLPPSSVLRPGSNVPIARSDVASTGGYGSYNPNPFAYQNAINAMPGVMGAQLAYNTGSAQADTTLRDLISQSVAQYGDPAIAEAMHLQVDPQTAALAASNTLAGHSTLGLLNLAKAHATDAMYSHLAATGLLHSGELGFEQGLNDQKASLDAFNASTALQNSLSAGRSADLNAKQNLSNAVTTAQINAANTMRLHPNQYPMPQPTSTTVGTVPPAGVMPGGPYHGSSLGAGSYQNVTGGGLPSYKPLAAPHLPGAATMAPPPTSIQRPAAAPLSGSMGGAQ